MFEQSSREDSHQMPDGQNPYQKIGLNLATNQDGTGPVKLKVISDSMRPFLQPGDIVSMSRVTAEINLQRGDIIVFRQPESATGALPLTHRLIGRSGAGWLAKGDARWLPDASFEDQAVLGLVVAIQRGQHQIELTSLGWRLLNRFLGWFHLCVGSLAVMTRNACEMLKVGKEVK